MEMEEIIDLGHPPIVVKNLEGAVALHHLVAGEREVQALNANGYERRRLGAQSGETLRFDLLPDCLYYIVARSEEAADLH